MSFEMELNRAYREIAQQINEMIPIEWEKFYFNGEAIDEEGGIFFFFTPKGKEEYIFSHYISKLFNIDKVTYYKEFHKLFQKTIELQKVFINNDQVPWFSVTILLSAEGKLKVHYDYADWHKSEFGPAARTKYFEYKYISKDKEHFDLDLMEKMSKFEEKNNH
ncbi:immunity protein YezG family protein [Oceanobacillus timonensis]|uniref:immunity protein YezG family protein n=1 Tax=Oceanobacillus timonensis TaxID=1926285 RepID=UPI0009BC0E67|nr:immunity protein YezG family protein [Oceanobacillus timonensis]